MTLTARNFICVITLAFGYGCGSGAGSDDGRGPDTGAGTTDSGPGRTSTSSGDATGSSDGGQGSGAGSDSDPGTSSSGGASTTSDGGGETTSGDETGGGQGDTTGGIGSTTGGGGTQELYTQIGTDPTWEEVLASGNLLIGEQSTIGFPGSTIDVHNDLVELGPHGSNPIPGGLRIHTVGHSSIPEADFEKWSRWYQEDGNTQVFRLFEGEHNVRNDRTQAARIEAFSPTNKWLPEPGVWREFEARYTILKASGCSAPHNCGIFQAKGNNVDHWSVMLNLDDQGNIWFNRRQGEDFIMAEDMVGKSFDVLVRDNGLDYEVYMDGELRGEGQWQRTEEIGFRWGLYVGASDVKGDVMVFVTGVDMR